MSDIFLEILDEQDFLEAPVTTIRDLAVRILEEAGVREGKVSIVLVDNETIHTLNRDFLNHDYPTDVLSFLIEEKGGHRYVEGEIVVSTEMAKERAGEFDWNPEQESLLYIVHGLLHLVGYEDDTKSAAKGMREKERHYLGGVGIAVPDGFDEWIDDEDTMEEFRRNDLN